MIVMGFMLLIMGCSSSDGKEASGSTDSNQSVSDNGEKETDANKDEANEKIKISMMMHWDDELFEEKFKQHIDKALPHIELTLIQANGTEEMENAFAKGLVPDIAMGSSFGRYNDLDLLMDQMPLIEQFGLDLSLYDQGVVESLKAASLVGELDALPVIKQGYVMTYNKDIFDAFGVPYPTDGMTWEETIELGKKLTGEVDGTKYHGIFPGSLSRQQLGVSLVDPETDEANVLDNKELRMYLEQVEEILNIPGNLPDLETNEEIANYMYSGEGGDTAFNFALFPFRDQANGLSWREFESGLNFDWVTFPVWGGEYEDYTPHEILNFMFVTSVSENPEAAFEVIAYFMSEEYQRWSVSTGTSTYLLDESIYDEFGKNLEHYDILAEKNLDALFAYPSAPVPEKSPYEAASPIQNAYIRILEGEDLNTILRKMDEEMNIIIAEQKGKE